MPKARHWSMTQKVPGLVQNLLLCRCSSVVEHVIGNDGVASPILASGTIKKTSLVEVFLMGAGKNSLRHLAFAVVVSLP